MKIVTSRPPKNWHLRMRRKPAPLFQHPVRLSDDNKNTQTTHSRRSITRIVLGIIVVILSIITLSFGTYRLVPAGYWKIIWLWPHLQYTIIIVIGVIGTIISAVILKCKYILGLSRLSQIAQVGLVILATYGYFYTVIPAYQLADVNEQLSQKRMELGRKEQEVAVAKREVSQKEQQVVEIRNELNQRVQRLADVEAKSVEAEQQLAKYEHDIKHLELDKSTLNKERVKLNETNKKLLSQIEISRDELVNSRKDLDGTRMAIITNKMKIMLDNDYHRLWSAILSPLIDKVLEPSLSPHFMKQLSHNVSMQEWNKQLDKWSIYNEVTAVVNKTTINDFKDSPSITRRFLDEVKHKAHFYLEANKVEIDSIWQLRKVQKEVEGVVHNMKFGFDIKEKRILMYKDGKQIPDNLILNEVIGSLSEPIKPLKELKTASHAVISTMGPMLYPVSNQNPLDLVK